MFVASRGRIRGRAEALGAAVLCCALLAPLPLAAGDAGPADPAPPPAADETDFKILQVVEGIVRLFRVYPNAVWPGFDLARDPFVVYRPDRWTLLVGIDRDLPGFSPFPAGWPGLDSPARFRPGPSEGLAGQLVFDYPVGDLRVLAAGAPDALPGELPSANLPYEAFLLGYLVHESFHQFQNGAFGEIPWDREEEYPILDVENTALATLEIGYLMEALRANLRADRRACRSSIRRFLAVRDHRWRNAPPFVRLFEQGLEIREGTAQYAEVRALDLARRLGRVSRVPRRTPLAERLKGCSAGELVLRSFGARLTAGSVSPEDMPRNRVYPVAAAQGLLLDLLGVEWKAGAQRAGPDFTYAALLRRRLRFSEGHSQRLLKKILASEELARAREAAAALSGAYLEQYSQALAEFEGQEGLRVTLTLPASGLRRSRVTAERKWLAEAGRRTLCSRYEVFTLDGEAISLRIEDHGVLEDIDWTAGARSLVFYISGELYLTAEGKPLVPEEGVAGPFSLLELQCPGVRLRCTMPGKTLLSGRNLRIDLPFR